MSKNLKRKTSVTVKLQVSALSKKPDHLCKNSLLFSWTSGGSGFQILYWAKSIIYTMNILY